MAPKKKKPQTRPTWSYELKNSIVGWILLCLGVLVFLGDSQSTAGSFVADIGMALYGRDYRFVFAPIVTILGVLIAINKLQWNSARFFGLLLFWISTVSLESIFLDNLSSIGVFDFGSAAVHFFGRTPTILFLVGGVLVSLYLTLRISYRKILGTIHSNLPSVETVKSAIRDVKREIKSEEVEEKVEKSNKSEKESYKEKERELREQIEFLKKERAMEDKKKTKKEEDEKVEIERKIPIERKDAKSVIAGFFGGGNTIEKGEPKQLSVEDIPEREHEKPDFGKWEFPSTNLLSQIEHVNQINPKEVEQKSLEIEQTLLQFKIDVDMMGQKVGPTVVQYRLKPSEGVKLSRIENLKKDLALALKAKSIRIQAPIPGVGLVGIEVPNDRRDTIGIREVLEDKNFTGHKSNLAMAVGKDINGDYVVADMGKMPHLLIAGQTGSGKSVGMNGFIISLLYRNSPDMLRFIMIDPKRVELAPYNGIPHLLTPVISDPEKALNSLKWSVAEMLRRYDVLQQARARNLGEFNEKVSKKERMPHIVIIIDELADFMMSGNKKEVENSIARIAQMARAVGMHLIVATQRPSVDVITGLIKANIPSRIAFTVASQVDSRTILDSIGAEDLLGYGDLLYSPVGSSGPERIQ